MLVWFLKHDFIFLFETKFEESFSVPGFIVKRSVPTKSKVPRGGTAVLVKHSLAKYVYQVEERNDQVWFKTQLLPNCTIGACYVAPADSPYFSYNSFADIQEQCLSSESVLILADLNARIPDLDQFNKEPTIKYARNPDRISNQRGKEIANLCKLHDLTPVNHLQVNSSQSYEGGLTYKKGENWVSQIDWSLISTAEIDNIQNFEIYQRIPLLTDHAALVLTMRTKWHDISEIQARASTLGKTEERKKKRAGLSKNAKIPKENFQNVLPSVEEAKIRNELSLSGALDKIEQVIENTTRQSRVKTQPTHATRNQSKWERIEKLNDPRTTWQAINWNGKITTKSKNDPTPSDKDFVKHFSQLLNDGAANLMLPDTQIYIPVLDNPILPQEVLKAIRDLKANSAAGQDNVLPRTLKMLTDEWVILITDLFNEVFYGQYPRNWTKSLTTTIFKSGDKTKPENYRGISVSPAIAKTYDKVLTNRFTLWYQPNVAQAGAKKGRSCEEQVLTLRLLIEAAVKKKLVLYVVFVDFVKAYDNLNRQTLINRLATKGCGKSFLHAIYQSLQCTEMLIGEQTLVTTKGIKQGQPSSCPLFTFALDFISEELSKLPEDSWLGKTNSLLFMDDTALLATSRTEMNNKLKVLHDTAQTLGMILHPTKSKFISVNANDKQDFIVQDARVKETDSYTYLGCKITPRSIREQTKTEIGERQKHIHKFTSFLAKNNDAPYRIKKKVFQCALQASVLYGSETWLVDTTPITNAIFFKPLKQLLGIRQQVPNNIALVESGICHITDQIQNRQRNFLQKLQSSPHYIGSPVEFAIKTARDFQTKSSQYIAQLIHGENDARSRAVKDLIEQDTRTRSETYRKMNPDLTTHAMYAPQSNIDDNHRIALTRLRTSSHHLRVETGRWCRTPYTERICNSVDCAGQIQDEWHALSRCERTKTLREQYTNIDFSTLQTFMKSETKTIAKFTHECLRCF